MHLGLPLLDARRAAAARLGWCCWMSPLPGTTERPPGFRPRGIQAAPSSSRAFHPSFPFLTPVSWLLPSLWSALGASFLPLTGEGGSAQRALEEPVGPRLHRAPWDLQPDTVTPRRCGEDVPRPPQLKAFEWHSSGVTAPGDESGAAAATVHPARRRGMASGGRGVRLETQSCFPVCRAGFVLRRAHRTQRA